MQCLEVLWMNYLKTNFIFLHFISQGIFMCTVCTRRVQGTHSLNLSYGIRVKRGRVVLINYITSPFNLNHILRAWSTRIVKIMGKNVSFVSYQNVDRFNNVIKLIYAFYPNLSDLHWVAPLWVMVQNPNFPIIPPCICSGFLWAGDDVSTYLLTCLYIIKKNILLYFSSI